MVFNTRIRSAFIVIVGLVCLVLNYCWQYQHCCDMVNKFTIMKHANEGSRPSLFFTVNRNKTSHHHVRVHLPLLQHKHKFRSEKDKYQERQSTDKKRGADGDFHKSSSGRAEKELNKDDRIKKGTKQKKNKKITNLLIVSQGRSGSSFVGQIFNHFRDVFFLYEPLLIVERVHNIDTFVGNNTEHYHKLSTKWLSEIFRCNFTKSENLEYLSRPGHFRLSSRVLMSPPFCSKDALNLTSKAIISQNKCTRIQANVLSKICKNFPIKVAKVLEHRLPNRKIQYVHEFLKKTDDASKILYLVRDPRAIISSMYYSGWISHRENKQQVPYEITSEKFHWYVKRICSQMEENLRYVQSQLHRPTGNIVLIRYEDLVMHTRDSTRKLLAFVGMRKTSDLNKWLYRQMHTMNSNEGGLLGRYSTAKNATMAMVKWRTEAPIQLVSVIEQYCRPVMDTLGYVLTNGSSNILQDLSSPLIKDR